MGLRTTAKANTLVGEVAYGLDLFVERGEPNAVRRSGHQPTECVTGDWLGEETEDVTYTIGCGLWQAPSGGDDCEICNEGEKPSACFKKKARRKT